MVRKQPKGRGTNRLVEGATLGAGTRVLLVDDIVTTGGSIQQAHQHVVDTGATVVAAVTAGRPQRHRRAVLRPARRALPAGVHVPRPGHRAGRRRRLSRHRRPRPFWNTFSSPLVCRPPSPAPVRAARRPGGHTMKTEAAILWETGGTWSVEEIELDPPKAGEVLVEMVASGLCHSDDHARTGDLPGGHAADRRPRGLRHRDGGRRGRHPGRRPATTSCSASCRPAGTASPARTATRTCATTAPRCSSACSSTAPAATTPAARTSTRWSASAPSAATPWSTRCPA